MTVFLPILVCLCGGVGASCRYLLDATIKTYWQRAFPLSTFTINLIAGFLTGLVAALALGGTLDEPWRLVLATGFLGGFSTFSTAINEMVTLFRKHRYPHRSGLSGAVAGCAGRCCGLRFSRLTATPIPDAVSGIIARSNVTGTSGRYMGMANNGADVKPNQGVGATNTSTTTNTAENTAGTATPKQNGLAVLGKYVGVSATQTIVEYATFAILHLIGVPSQIANGIAVVCSATYNFVMNRNVTFKSSSNFTRSVALFVLLWIWNFTFSTLLIGWMPGATGLSPYVVKFIAMACQFGWGYPLCKYVIFR